MSDRTPLPARLNGVCSWVARHERYLWAGVIAAVLIMQWPLLKGVYYRAAGTPVPPTSIEWRTDLGAALVEARRTDTILVLDHTGQVIRRDAFLTASGMMRFLTETD